MLIRKALNRHCCLAEKTVLIVPFQDFRFGNKQGFFRNVNIFATKVVVMASVAKLLVDFFADLEFQVGRYRNIALVKQFVYIAAQEKAV